MDQRRGADINTVLSPVERNLPQTSWRGKSPAPHKCKDCQEEDHQSRPWCRIVHMNSHLKHIECKRSRECTYSPPACACNHRVQTPMLSQLEDTMLSKVHAWRTLLSTETGTYRSLVVGSPVCSRDGTEPGWIPSNRE
jgi:hypothetical protein